MHVNAGYLKVLFFPPTCLYNQRVKIVWLSCFWNKLLGLLTSLKAWNEQWKMKIQFRKLVNEKHTVVIQCRRSNRDQNVHICCHSYYLYFQLQIFFIFISLPSTSFEFRLMLIVRGFNETIKDLSRMQIGNILLTSTTTKLQSSLFHSK